jgi:glyoxylase-like metal-dependent hydrolase (beta-lactamase superfamily II)
LRKLGLEHTDIDVVVLSHLHFDHIGGLFSSWRQGHAPRLLFPNAQYIVGDAHFKHALQPHYRDKASFPSDLLELLRESGRLKLVGEDEKAFDLPGVSFRFSDGHTPGLMLAELATPSGPLVFCSDLIPGQHWVHLPICMGYDRFPEKLIDEKKVLLEYLLQCEGRLFFTHDATMACGKVVKDAKGRFSVQEVALNR